MTEITSDSGSLAPTSRKVPYARYLWALFAVVNIALLLYTVPRIFASRHNHIDETPLAYGARVDLTQAGLPQAATSSKYSMLVFLTGKEPPDALRYFDLLAGRHDNSQLAVTAVVPGGSVASVVSERAPHLRVFVDKALKLHAAMNIPAGHAHGGLVILENPDRVVFHWLKQLGDDDLRQLAERYAQGSIDFIGNPDPMFSLFRPGRPLPDLLVTSLAGASPVPLSSLANGNATFVVFSSPCTSCQLNEALGVLSPKLRQGAPTGTVPAGLYTLLFAEQFSPKLIESFMKAAGLEKVPAYSMKVPDDARYVTRASGNTPEPLLIESSNGVVARVARITR